MLTSKTCVCVQTRTTKKWRVSKSWHPKKVFKIWFPMVLAMCYLCFPYVLHLGKMTGSFVKKAYIFEITFTKKEQKIVDMPEPSFSSCVVLAI